MSRNISKFWETSPTGACSDPSRRTPCRICPAAWVSVYYASGTLLTYRYEGPREIYERYHCDEDGRSCQNDHTSILFLSHTLVPESESVCEQHGGIVTPLLQEKRCPDECSCIPSRISQSRLNLQLGCFAHTTSCNQRCTQGLKTVRNFFETRKNRA